MNDPVDNPDSPALLDSPQPQQQAVPVLGEGFHEMKSTDASASGDSSAAKEETDEKADGSGPSINEPSKRRFFGLVKKKDKGKDKAEVSNSNTATDGPDHGGRSISAKGIPSPLQSTHPYQAYSPPAQRTLHSSSPRAVSPAGSQIFERDVQESSVPVPNSPAIPSHIQTENHIPSVLDASSEAITDSHLDPDSVEIVTHSAHQPAALSVTGANVGEAGIGSMSEDLLNQPEKDDSVSNFGALDSTDVRRLSFISFADVVQSEHAEHSNMRDPIHIAGLISLSSGHRSPSPMRSPVSSPTLGSSPPTSKSASIRGLETSPTRSGMPPTSPTAALAPPEPASNLTIETMSQAVKKTQNSDLSGGRSVPLSPISPDGNSERTFR